MSDQAGLMSSFPSFDIGSEKAAAKDLGFLESYGDFFGFAYAIGK